MGERKVSLIGLGTWQFGSTSWGWGREFDLGDVQAIVDRALELGVTLFDTAEIYARGASETLLGQALGDRRGNVIVATKVSPMHAR